MVLGEEACVSGQAFFDPAVGGYRRFLDEAPDAGAGDLNGDGTREVVEGDEVVAAFNGIEGEGAIAPRAGAAGCLAEEVGFIPGFDDADERHGGRVKAEA